MSQHLTKWSTPLLYNYNLHFNLSTIEYNDKIVFMTNDKKSKTPAHMCI